MKVTLDERCRVTDNRSVEGKVYRTAKTIKGKDNTPYFRLGNKMYYLGEKGLTLSVSEAKDPIWVEFKGTITIQCDV